MYEYILKDLNVLKIKIGLRHLFQKKISKKLNLFLKTKTSHL
jgi:hypothetical protein